MFAEEKKKTTEEMLAIARRRREELERRIGDLELRVARLEASARLRMVLHDHES